MVQRGIRSHNSFDKVLPIPNIGCSCVVGSARFSWKKSALKKFTRQNITIIITKNKCQIFQGMHKMYVCLLNKPIELYHSTTYFDISLIFLQILTDISESPDCVHFTKSMVDNLSNNSNLYKKRSTCPKLTLYLPTVKNMMAHILWLLAMIFKLKFLINLSFNCEISSIQAKVVVSAYSVSKAWYGHDGVLLRQGQHFNPVLLFIITLTGRA